MNELHAPTFPSVLTIILFETNDIEYMNMKCERQLHAII